MSSILMSLSACFCLAAGADIVELRDGRGELRGTVQASDQGSLRLEMNGKRQHVPWDLVRDIRFENPASKLESMEDHLQRAVEIWRARSRLQRGDANLAEPLFEELFEASVAHRDETDLIIAEGLLRCRLSRGELVEALVPALETARLRSLGVQTDRYDELSVIHDPVTELCIYLPPAWPEAKPMPRLIQQLENWDAGGNDDLSLIASKYRILIENPDGHVVRTASDEDPDTAKQSDSNHSGVKLLELVLQSRDQDPSIRRSARSRIKAMLNRSDDWKQPWLRYFIGMSLLHEPGEGMRRQGLVELAWLPAQHSAEHPYLAGTAMGIMARELAKQGEHDAAARLQEELCKRYANHPACRYELMTAGDHTQEDLMR